MVIIDSDHKAMMKQLESGDDSVLLIIADWYEDRGDPLAVGLRRIIEENKYPFEWIQKEIRMGIGTFEVPKVYSWMRRSKKHLCFYELCPSLFDRLIAIGAGSI